LPVNLCLEVNAATNVPAPTTAVLVGAGRLAAAKEKQRAPALRKSFSRNECRLDQFLWSILDEDWRSAKTVSGPDAPVHGRAVTVVH